MNGLVQRFYCALDAAWRHRYAIVIPIIILPIAGLMIGLLSPKQYASHTSMLIQETAKMNPFLEDLAVSSMLKERMAALDTLLHSRYILTGVAISRGLIDDDTPPAAQEAAIARLSSALSMKMAGKDLIRIDYRANSPIGMKETLEAVSEQFIEQLMAPERSSIQDSTTFLAENLELRRRDLEAAEAALAEFKNRHAAQLPELHSGNVTRLAHLEQRLLERQAELAGATKSLGGLGQQLSRTNPVVNKIEEQIVRIRGELTLLRARYTDQHSKVQGALRNLRRLEAERLVVIKDSDAAIDADKLWAIASSSHSNGESQPLLISQLEHLQQARSKVDSLSEESASLEQRIAELKKQNSEFGAKEQQLSKLQRDLKVKRKLYEKLLERHEMARLTGSLGIFEREKRIKLIDRPYTPSTPVNMPPIIFVLAGFFGGTFLGIGIAVVLELADGSVRRRDQLSEITGVPVLARIPPLQPISGANTVTSLGSG